MWARHIIVSKSGEFLTTADARENISLHGQLHVHKSPCQNIHFNIQNFSYAATPEKYQL